MVRTNIPEYLQVRFNDYRRLQEEYDTLVSTLRERGGFRGLVGRKMPRIQYDNCRARIREIEFQVRALCNVATAIRMGYEPYSVPTDWHAGYAERPKGSFDDWGIDTWRTTSEPLRRTFRAPMPPDVLDEYRRAKLSGLFTHFIVAAPDPTLFEVPSSMFCDPVLIGYIPQEVAGMRFGTPLRWERLRSFEQPGLHVRNGVGFLISMWDLEKDREVAGIN